MDTIHSVVTRQPFWPRPHSATFNSKLPHLYNMSVILSGYTQAELAYAHHAHNSLVPCFCYSKHRHVCDHATGWRVVNHVQLVCTEMCIHVHHLLKQGIPDSRLSPPTVKAGSWLGSFIPRMFPPPVFDCLQYANTEGEGWGGRFGHVQLRQVDRGGGGGCPTIFHILCWTIPSAVNDKWYWNCLS